VKGNSFSTVDEVVVEVADDAVAEAGTEVEAAATAAGAAAMSIKNFSILLCTCCSLKYSAVSQVYPTSPGT
jgi:hypothetical protein